MATIFTDDTFKCILSNEIVEFRFKKSHWSLFLMSAMVQLAISIAADNGFSPHRPSVAPFTNMV